MYIRCKNKTIKHISYLKFNADMIKNIYQWLKGNQTSQATKRLIIKKASFIITFGAGLIYYF